MKKFIVLSVLVVSMLLVTAKPANATFNLPHCPNGTHGTWPICIPNSTPRPSTTPTPTASPTVTPTATPEATLTPTPTSTPCGEWNEEEEPCETSTPIPVETPRPEVPLTPAGAPALANCTAPLWAPTVTYDGQKGDTFTYHWTTVENGLHDYWIDWGATPTSLPYSMIVHEEKVSITMFGGLHTNWIRVAGYKEPGCRGPFSLIVN